MWPDEKLDRRYPFPPFNSIEPEGNISLEEETFFPRQTDAPFDNSYYIKWPEGTDEILGENAISSDCASFFSRLEQVSPQQFANATKNHLPLPLPLSPHQMMSIHQLNQDSSGNESSLCYLEHQSDQPTTDMFEFGLATPATTTTNTSPTKCQHSLSTSSYQSENSSAVHYSTRTEQQQFTDTFSNVCLFQQSHGDRFDCLPATNPTSNNNNGASANDDGSLLQGPVVDVHSLLENENAGFVKKEYSPSPPSPPSIPPTPYFKDITSGNSAVQSRWLTHVDYSGCSGGGVHHCAYQSTPPPASISPGPLLRIRTSNLSHGLMTIGGHLETNGNKSTFVACPSMASANTYRDSQCRIQRRLTDEQNLLRKAKVARYLEKRKRRNWSHMIRYASRKAYAENRPRIKGRFARQEEVEALVMQQQHQQQQKQQINSRKNKK